MYVNPGLAAGPSQYFTLDAVCWYGCKETGAGNCEEICQVAAPSPTQQAVVGQAAGQAATQASPQTSLIPGVNNTWLLAGAVALAVILAAR